MKNIAIAATPYEIRRLIGQQENAYPFTVELDERLNFVIVDSSAWCSL